MSIGKQLERKWFSVGDGKVVVDRSSFSCVGSVFHARGAPTEIRRFVDVSLSAE